MCVVCERISQIKKGENPYFVTELETGYVVFGDHQRFEGYTLFLAKNHVSEIYDLNNDVKMQHLNEMSIVAEAVANIFQPNKMNYESLGNSAAHLHWHLYPRYIDDMPINGPVWWLAKDELYAEEYETSVTFIERYRDVLKKEITSLLER